MNVILGFLLAVAEVSALLSSIFMSWLVIFGGKGEYVLPNRVLGFLVLFLVSLMLHRMVAWIL